MRRTADHRASFVLRFALYFDLLFVLYFALRFARGEPPGRQVPVTVRLRDLLGELVGCCATNLSSYCDYVFLAADTHLARAVFNALVFGFCVPGTQVGSKVIVDEDGTVGNIFSVVRPVGIEAGCMWCNGLISAANLNDELLPTHVREAQHYLPNNDAPAPSVITLNAIGVAQALNNFTLKTTGLLDRAEVEGDYRRFEARTESLITEMPRRDAGCAECGVTTASLRARAAFDSLPTRRSSPTP